MTLLNASVKHAQPTWREGLAVSALLAVPVVWWLVSVDGLSLSWDSLNHHFYLGWLAWTGRSLAHDVFAAGSMSCQYPYSYVPLYWLEQAGATGRQAAVILALPALAMIPAVWLISRTLLPAASLSASFARLAWTALGLVSPLWWSLIGSTSNDLSSSAPMVWAFALALWRGTFEAHCKSALKDGWTLAWWSAVGALVAVSLVMKISHVFTAIGLATLIIATSPSLPSLCKRLCGAVLGCVSVLLLIWWPWAREAWAVCGSPIYPIFVEQLGPWRHQLP